MRFSPSSSSLSWISVSAALLISQLCDAFLPLPSRKSMCLHLHQHPVAQPQIHRRNESCATKGGELVFLGSGSSTGTPVPWHLMSMARPEEGDILTPAQQQGRVSWRAIQGPPEENKNYRCNPSLLLRVMDEDGANPRYILFDAGKTFRESLIRWTPIHHITSIDAVFLTHPHADAIFGLDDLRGTQPADSDALPVYLSSECLKIVRQVFYYLFPLPDQAVKRFVSKIDWNVIEHWKEITVFGVRILPFPVMHGEDMVSTAFVIGRSNNVVYISDVSRIPNDSLKYLQSFQADLLVIDTLFKTRRHSTHICMEEAVEICRLLRPKKCLLLGMGSEIEYHETNAQLLELQREGLNIQLSHDGLKVQVVV